MSSNHIGVANTLQGHGPDYGRHPSLYHGPSNDEYRGKRRRVTRACDNCKTRKRRCTGEKPCSYCVERSAQCSYDLPYTRGKQTEPQSISPAYGSGHQSDNVNRDVQCQWPRDMLARTATHPIALTDMQHSGGPSSRARSPETSTGQYLGPTSAFSFIRRASTRFGATDALIAAPEETRSDVSIFQLGDRKVPELDTSCVTLPEPHECLALFSRYFEFVMATYRFLHQPTMQTWLKSYQTDENLSTITISSTRRAIVLLVLATASLYNVDSSHAVIPHKPGEESFMAGEKFFQAAQKLMNGETGPARLESVQARILSSLYLLNTSRLHQAWYSFGTATQLIVALGIHRSASITSTQPDLVVAECRKRSFWTAYTLDTYFSVMLGRPPYIQEAFADQDYPQLVNDKDLSSKQIVERTKNIDCAITASILHAKVAAIVRQASKEQYLLHRTTEDQQLRTAARLNREIARWQDELPVFLSGAVQPESLIPMFRRQLTVLRIACAHAVMLINRPLILSRHTAIAEIQPHVEECLSATKTALDVALDLATSSRIFSAYWNIQYVTFNALSIVYVWIIQRKIGRLANVQSRYREADLFELAETVQSHLATVTQKNAPNLRYSLILGELQLEAKRAVCSSHSVPSGDPGISSSSGSQGSVSINSASTGQVAGSTDWELNSVDFPLDPNLWLQLDAFPFTENYFHDGSES